MDLSRLQNGTPPPGMGQHRRTSGKSQNGHSDGSTSPVSRNGTPNMYGNQLHPFDGSALNEHQFHHGSPSMLSQHLRAPSPGHSESSMNGDRNMDGPQTYEQLIAANASLKTRVSELEVINELFRGRVTQLEQDEANARRGEDMRRDAEMVATVRLEDSQRRENQLKRKIDDLENEIAELRKELADNSDRPAKKMRLADMVEETEASTPLSIDEAAPQQKVEA